MQAEPRTLAASARLPLRDYLADLDAALPGVVRGVYVTGSAALDDHWAEYSDLDVLCELSHPPGEVALLALHRTHRRVQAYYRAPGTLLEVNEGRLSRPGTLTPVTVRELARHAVPVRGAVPDGDPPDAAVRAYCLANLGGYWRDTVERERLVCGDPAGRTSATAVRWAALGPARLWYSVATGDIVSKRVAGAVAAARWPEVAPAIADVLASRADPAIRLTKVHLAAAVLLYDSIGAELGFLRRSGAQPARGDVAAGTQPSGEQSARPR